LLGRKKIVAGNWKMNLTSPEAKALVNSVVKASENVRDVIKIFIPPFVFIHDAINEIKGAQFFVGAQNCSEHDKGAFTGEVSATMLQSAGCKYVLVGHSERRMFFKETNEQLTSKLKQALNNSLNPIFCFGEQLAERKAGKHFDTVKLQLEEVLKNIDKLSLSKIVLAYEPVWAIGTGETATPQQAQEMHAFVRECIEKLADKELASQISILYGGSCNAQNAKELFACKDVDGGLIGGASLKADDFCKIINSF
jgi:triosephosphate isomerase (TIM)